MKFTLYRADRLGMPENCIYPHKVEVTDKNTLLQAVSYDYVCAEYRGNYRNNDNFLGADCLPVDCDNDHSDDPGEWVYPSDVAAAFPGVAFAVHYSRNHMKAKNGKEARPKFHVLFPIDRLTDAAQYSDLKKLVNTLFPYFDTKALDAARFFFGTKAPQVDVFDGPMMLTTFLADDDFDANMDSGSYGGIIIPEGSRNATMSHYAGRILKRFGNTDEARKHFTVVAACCQPPLEQSELDSIWRSAQRFYGKISAQGGYIPPEQYNQELKLKPTDYSDVGQATVLSREYEAKLRYTPSTDFLVYNGGFWEESKPRAQAVAQELTTRQLEEAETEIRKTTDEMMKNGRPFGKDYFDELLERIREIRASERRAYQKIADVFEQCSYDYDKNSETTKAFYAFVQNKLHYAVTGKTAAELISERATLDSPTMGLTTWKGAPDGKILKSDTLVAKNYLNEKELSRLNRLVTMFIDYAELMAEDEQLMSMQDWLDETDRFLNNNRRKVLDGKGHISREAAAKKVGAIYNEFRKKQDAEYISEFDRQTEKYLKGE